MAVFRTGTAVFSGVSQWNGARLDAERVRHFAGLPAIQTPVLRSAPILRTEAGVTTSSKTLRAEHSLVARAFHAADAADARRILLVSAHSRDGKSHFARCISRHASVVTDAPVQVHAFAMPHLEAEGQHGHVHHGYVWVDGVALLEGEGPAELTPAVRAYFDGALFITRGMVTTRAEVADCADRLRILGMRMLGGVWNEYDCPPVAEAVRIVKAGLFSWPPRFPFGVSTPQIRRPS